LFFRRYSIKQSPDPIGIDLKKTRHHAPLARPQTISVVVRGPGLLVRSWDRALFCSSVERQSRSCTLPLQRLGDFARPRSHPRTPGRRGSLGSSAQTRSLGPIDLSQKRKKRSQAVDRPRAEAVWPGARGSRASPDRLADRSLARAPASTDPSAPARRRSGVERRPHLLARSRSTRWRQGTETVCPQAPGLVHFS
jgi:hypothetical protein